MKTRSPLILCLPLALFLAACLLSLPTFVVAVVWMTIGVMALGHRTFESFPSNGIRREWLRGYRAAFVWFYHLAWWPRYTRSSIHDIAGQIGAAMHRAKKSGGKGPDSPSDHESSGNRE
jgi:ABC-type dipeptide/oligopeptide/nickel transport system permease component